MLRNLTTDLLLHEQIKTTLSKAKALRPVAEKVISRGRDDSVHNRRQAARVIYRNDIVQKLFEVIGPRYRSRPGGYIRIVRVGFRHGDNAPMAIIELVERDLAAKGSDGYTPIARYGAKEDDPDD